MSTKTLTSVSQLERHIRKVAENSDLKVLSFDIFDTLIFRKVADNAVIDASCNWLSQELTKMQIEPVGDILKSREQSYLKIAARNQNAGSDKDATLREFVGEWLKNLAGENDKRFKSLANKLLEFELKLECELSYTDPELLDLLRRLKGEDFKLIYCSDMYLGSELIDKLLQHHGYGDIFEARYVSSDHRKFKWSGKLYREILRHENIEPEAILHIGDNSYSDGKIARKNRIPAVILKNKANLKRKRHLQKLYDSYKTNSQTGGTFLATSCRQGIFEISNQNQRLGFEIVAPLFVAFVHKTCQQIKERNIRKVYFVARDGLIFKKIFDLIAPMIWSNGDLPESFYLEVSRASVFPAFSREINLDDFRKWIEQNEKRETLTSCLKRYGVDDEGLSQLKNHAAAIDFGAELFTRDLVSGPVRDFLLSPVLEEIIRQTSTTSAKRLELYLERKNFFTSSSNALIDIGWSGSTQTFLAEIFKERKDCPKLEGFYFALKKDAMKNQSDKNILRAMISDGSKSGFYSWSAFSFLHCLELLCSAPHGTITGYDDSGQPLMMADSNPVRIAEKKNEATIRQIHQAVLLYAKIHIQLATAFNIDPDSMVSYAQTLLHRIARHPEIDEASLLLSLIFSDSFGREDSDLLGRNFSGKSLSSRLRGIVKNEHQNAQWGRGVVETYQLPFAGIAYAIGGAYRLMSNNTDNDSGNTKTNGKSSLTQFLNTVKESLLSSTRKANAESHKIDPLGLPFNNTDLLFYELERMVVNTLLKSKGLKTFDKDGLG